MHPTVTRTADQVSAEIARQLEGDERLRGSRIAVHALEGSWGYRIRLQGRVRSWDDRIHAERCAWGWPGVTGVDNALIATA